LISVDQPVEECIRAARVAGPPPDEQGSTIANTERIRTVTNRILRPRPLGETMADDRRTLTNRQGHPLADNQNQRTVGARGPATLENYQFLEKISHFDRERIPERVVHARGTTSYGYFEAYGT